MTTDKIEIHTAIDADVRAICQIYRHSVLNETASWEYDPPDEAEMYRRYTEIVNGGFPFLVARIDGKVVGFAYANNYRTRIGYRFCVENSVYIDASHRAKGIGVKLLSALINKCTDKGFKQIARCEEAGADLIRVSVPDEASSAALKEIVKGANVPIIADIHFLSLIHI